MNPFDKNAPSIDPNDPNLVLSPLADPVANAIFSSLEEAGLASESIIRAVLSSDKSSKIAGKIIRVTAQRTHILPNNRGCRVDIEIETDANEIFRCEIQISPDANILVRNLFSTSHLFVEKSVQGDTAAQMAAKMPTVIYINLLCYNLRETNTDLVQPVKVMYTKPPHEVAIPNFVCFNVQLPRILKMQQNFTNDLYCWCYTLYTAHLKKKTVKEVVSMTPELQTFAEKDTGFQQFYDRYETVSSSPQTRREYVSWVNALMREDGIREAGRQACHREGLQEGYAEAEQKRIADLAEAEKKRKEEMVTAIRTMKAAGVSVDIIASAYPLSEDEIAKL
jgi:predicted transposase/invertase (TIGR01784 family)